MRSFATRYINWTWRDVASDMAALALRSVGQARSELAMSAAQTETDSTLRQAEIANVGVVEAVAPLAGQRRKWVVVTREATTAARSAGYEGLAPAWHVAIATVERSHAGNWVLSGWQPES